MEAQEINNYIVYDEGSAQELLDEVEYTPEDLVDLNITRILK